MTKRISKSKHEARARLVANKMRRLFGGTTRVVGVGSWSHAGAVIREPVFLVESFCGEREWKKNARGMHDYLQMKKHEWRQESLTMEWEHLSKDLSYEGMHFL